jgi:hypothetical protein
MLKRRSALLRHREGDIPLLVWTPDETEILEIIMADGDDNVWQRCSQGFQSILIAIECSSAFCPPIGGESQFADEFHSGQRFRISLAMTARAFSAKKREMLQ